MASAINEDEEMQNALKKIRNNQPPLLASPSSLSTSLSSSGERRPDVTSHLSHTQLRARQSCLARCRTHSHSAFPPFGIPEIMIAIFSALTIIGVVLKEIEAVQPPWDIYAEYPVIFVSFFSAFGVRQAPVRLGLEVALIVLALLCFMSDRLDERTPLDLSFMGKLIFIGIGVGWLGRFCVVLGMHICVRGRGVDYEEFIHDHRSNGVGCETGKSTHGTKIARRVSVQLVRSLECTMTISNLARGSRDGSNGPAAAGGGGKGEDAVV